MQGSFATILTRQSSKVQRRVPKYGRGLIDTSVLIDFEDIEGDALPGEMAMASISLAELAAGPHATLDPMERARRQERLQRAVVSRGPKAHGRRAMDMLTAASDFDGLEGLIELIAV